jgi:type VI secretion system protein ImpA
VFNVRSINGVSKRDDALYLLEVAATYFRTHEPSSPVPLLIDRARRLGEMDFLDLLRDLAPDGVNQAENIFGRPPV